MFFELDDYSKLTFLRSSSPFDIADRHHKILLNSARITYSNSNVQCGWSAIENSKVDFVSRGFYIIATYTDFLNIVLLIKANL